MKLLYIWQKPNDVWEPPVFIEENLKIDLDCGLSSINEQEEPHETT